MKLLWGNQKMLREYGEGVTIKNGEKNLPYPGLGLEQKFCKEVLN